MSQVAEQTAEVVADVVEETIDGTVEVLEIVKSNPKMAIAAAVLGAIAGGAGGYFIARAKLRSYYEDLSTQEIAEAKEFYANLHKVNVDGETLSPHDVMVERHGVEAAAEALRSYQGEEPVLSGEPHDEIVDEEHIAKLEREARRRRRAAGEEEPVPVDSVEDLKAETDKINVFVDVTFDLEEEKKSRTPDEPYIITHDEYFEGEKDYDTVTLTYFVVDDTLVDERDKPVDDSDATVGDGNLVRFGAGSKDNNIVYVRNERLETDFEIVRSKGSYLEEVLGMPETEGASLKHSADQRRAFRRGEG